jgi:hypothetical protein
VGSVLHFCCLGLDCHDSYLSCSSATSKLWTLNSELCLSFSVLCYISYKVCRLNTIIPYTVGPPTLLCSLPIVLFLSKLLCYLYTILLLTSLPCSHCRS